MSLLRVERHGTTLLLTLEDPARRNILSAPLCLAISEAVAAANADPEARALVITGAGPAFCAGANLATLEAAAAGQTAEVEAVYKAFIDVADCRLPTLAAVNGPAVGAGFNLALACDLRLASPAARFDTRFLKLGLHPGGGHAWLLIRAVGWAAAARLLLGEQGVDADEAFCIGLTEATVAPEDLINRAIGFFSGLANRPRELVLRTKATMRHAAKSDHAAAFTHETEEQRWSLGQPAFADAVARAKKR